MREWRWLFITVAVGSAAACGGRHALREAEDGDVGAEDGGDPVADGDPEDECSPDCERRSCGPDGCGGTCPSYCGPDEACLEPEGRCIALARSGPLTAGAFHACGLDEDGFAWCWGNNHHGELGDGTTTTRHEPVRVVGLGRVAGITAGYQHTCAWDEDGSPWCWGNNGGGELGAPVGPRSLEPVAVPEVGPVTGISAGTSTTCAWRDPGTPGYGSDDWAVWCWGSGWLGDGERSERRGPTLVEGLQGIVYIAPSDHVCALGRRGAMWCWGENEDAQLGDGTRTDRPEPGVDPVLDGLSGLALGHGRTYAWRDDRAFCFGLGWSSDGACARGPSDLCHIQGIATGHDGGHGCAWDASRSAWCWGSNGSGQLGDGTTLPCDGVVAVAFDGEIHGVTVGHQFTCAWDRERQWWCWGRNDSGQLGDGTTTSRHVPTRVALAP